MAPDGHFPIPYINLPEIFHPVAKYMWEIFAEATLCQNRKLPRQEIEIGTSGIFSITTSFRDFLSDDIIKVAEKYSLPEGLDIFRNEEPLACCFYLINSLHERLLHRNKMDKYGRYPYKESIQYANQLIEINYVQGILDDLYEELFGVKVQKRPTKLFWSHDIDYLYSAWKSDLISIHRNKSYSQIPGVLWEILTKPHRWKNIEEILQLEKQYDIRSYFFWLTEQGKKWLKNKHFIDHADYKISQPYIMKLLNEIAVNGSSNGLHKSAFSWNFQEEIHKLPIRVIANRNHFLKMTLPQHYDQIEMAGLEYDATLGFAEHHGFRNSFGRPFQPYNLSQNRAYAFTEIPLQIMDTTLFTYLDQNLEQMSESILRFVQKNQHSSVISILLHNTSFDFRDKAEMQIWHRLFHSLCDYECFIPT